MKVLLIEDDASTAAYVSGGLREEGHEVDHVASGPLGLELALTRSYDVGTLFRRAQPVVQGEEGQAVAEAGRIIANGIAQGEVPEADRAYLAQLVAARAEIPQQEARARVDATVTRAQQAAEQAKQAAETARKSAATTALFTALSMLIGAFIAATAAALAGRSRDT